MAKILFAYLLLTIKINHHGKVWKKISAKSKEEHG